MKFVFITVILSATNCSHLIQFENFPASLASSSSLWQHVDLGHPRRRDPCEFQSSATTTFSSKSMSDPSPFLSLD